MRHSSVIVFVAFALLTSASSIDDYGRRNNSLWRRVTGGSVKGGSSNNEMLQHPGRGRSSSPHPPGGGRSPSPQPHRHTVIDYRDLHGTLLQYELVNGEIVQAKVTFAGTPESPPITFYPENELEPPGQQHTFVVHELNNLPPAGSGRDFFGEHGIRMVSHVTLRNGRWMIFYPLRPGSDPSRHNYYSFIEDRLTGGGSVQKFFKPGAPAREVLYYINFPNGDGVGINCGLHHVEWLDAPPTRPHRA